MWTLGKKAEGVLCDVCTDGSLVIPLTAFFQFSHELKTFRIIWVIKDFIMKPNCSDSIHQVSYVCGFECNL